MIETKVKASGLAALAAGLIDWALGQYVFKGNHVDAAVTAEVYAAVPAVIAFAAGYLAPHTSRPAPVPAAPSNVTVVPAAAQRGGYAAGSVTTDELPPPPASVSMPAPDPASAEKLVPPPAAAP